MYCSTDDENTKVAGCGNLALLVDDVVSSMACGGQLHEVVVGVHRSHAVVGGGGSENRQSDVVEFPTVSSHE